MMKWLEIEEGINYESKYDLDTSLIQQWVVSHIRKPIQGFEHKKNPDGSWYSYEQQLIASQCQIFMMIMNYIKMGKGYRYIMDRIKYYCVEL